ncbi:hypothetical protein JMUB3936_1413 [Leptotrichia wadei]|uniref:Uncharacterized protein n=1 Tax=Leptotrichia wadei TaxID=157687 RepID=A0A510KTV2_9FUSO|nr:hypothetical protein [Leptotrichia wadei]BBM55129.1 hypothetical protein JMUB3936_1413 [Leptotrichia wadei]
MLNLYLEEVRQASKGIYELLKSLNIMEAEGYVLDKFGTSFNLKRDTNEKDENYRKEYLLKFQGKVKCNF